MPTAKSLILAAGSAAQFATKYVTQRIHRKLDDRDNLFKSALLKMESKDLSEWPCLEKMNQAANQTAITNYTITGKNLANDAVTAVVSFFEGEDYEMHFEAVVPGEQTFEVALESSGVANSTISWAWANDVLTATIGTAATAAQVAASVTSDAVAKYFLQAGVTEARGSTPVSDSTALDATILDVSEDMADGDGELCSVIVGGVAVSPDGTNAIGITSYSDTSIVFAIHAGVITHHEVVEVRVDANNLAVQGLSHVAI